MSITTPHRPNESNPDDAEPTSAPRQDFADLDSQITQDHDRRRRTSVWVSAVVAVGAALALIAFLATRPDKPSQSDTVTSSEQAGEFTESDGDGSSDSETAATADDAMYSQSYVVADPDGTFINIEVAQSADSPDTTITGSRSGDGEAWEPLELSGFPAGQLDSVVTDGPDIVARVYGLDEATSSMGFSGPNRIAALSTDAQHWTQLKIPTPDPIENWQAITDVFDAAHLPDGRIIAVASVRWEPDPDSLDPAFAAALNQGSCGYSSGIVGDVYAFDISSCGDSTGQHFEIPIPAEIPRLQLEGGPGGDVWLLNADGTDPKAITISADYPLTDSVTATTDGVRAIVDTAPASFEEVAYHVAVATSLDGETWNVTPTLLNPGQYTSMGSASAHYDGVDYVYDMNVKRSVDGGVTWESAGELPASEGMSPQFFTAGKAGLATVAQTSGWIQEPQEFHYEADDGTTLSGKTGGPVGPDGPIDSTQTWTLTTPNGATFTYSVSDTSLPDSTGDPNVTASLDEEVGDLTLTFLSPDDGSELLEVGINAIYNSEIDPYRDTYRDLTITAEKDGYTLAMPAEPGPEATFTLTGPDGATVMQGSLDELNSGEMIGVESTQDPTNTEMRFFDPETDETLVVFTDDELQPAYEAAYAQVMTDMSEPFTVTQGDYTMTGSYPMGHWTVSDRQGVIAEFDDPYGDDPGRPADLEGVVVDPLTQALTIEDDNGEALVTFSIDQITATLTEDSGFSRDESYGLFFSPDQGATWTEITEIRSWVTSLAVGDDEILVTVGGSTTPIRIPVPRS